MVTRSKNDGMYIPSEAEEQNAFCRWMDNHGVLYAHVPNEGKRTLATGKRLKDIGLKSGFPDIIILDKPPKPEYTMIPGTVIEMQSQSIRARPSREQKW